MCHLGAEAEALLESLGRDPEKAGANIGGRPGAEGSPAPQLLLATLGHSAPQQQRAPHLFTAARCFRTNLLPRSRWHPDYTVEVMNRFSGLGLVDRVPENYGQRFVALYRR